MYRKNRKFLPPSAGPADTTMLNIVYKSRKTRCGIGAVCFRATVFTVSRLEASVLEIQARSCLENIASFICFLCSNRRQLSSQMSLTYNSKSDFLSAKPIPERCLAQFGTAHLLRVQILQYHIAVPFASSSCDALISLFLQLSSSLRYITFFQ